MNFLIYTINEFDNDCGGLVVQYYLASLLEEHGISVRIKAPKNIENNIFNKWYQDGDPFDIVLYGETIPGNPMYGKHVVRWILAELGVFSSIDINKTWGPNDLVYYYYGLYDNILRIQYINPNVCNTNLLGSRKEYCHTFRKSFLHEHEMITVPDNSYEVSRQADYVKIFNEYKYFICYDPCTLLLIIAPLCGCITIIHPYKGYTRKEWLTFWNFQVFLEETNTELYGVAYGYEPSEIEFAKNTLHLAKGLIDNYNNNTNKLPTFIKSIRYLSDIEKNNSNNH